LLKAACAAALIIGALAALSDGALADPVKTTIYRFKGGKDGAWPLGPLVSDKAGNLYGVTFEGGVNDMGTVFMLSPPVAPDTRWKKTILHTFAGKPNDGRRPMTRLTLHGSRIYGTTFSDGIGQPGSSGSVFRLTPPKDGGAWTYEILHSFTEDVNGYGPAWPLVLDADGAIYGLLMAGGAVPRAAGVVYKLTPAKKAPWPQTVLYTFTDLFDGGPHVFGGASGLIFDATGALITTSFAGGANNAGTVFRFSPSSSSALDILHSFGGSNSGDSYPTFGVVADATGVLYGTTSSGGVNGTGTVFMLTPPVAPATAWTYSKLYDAPADDPNTPQYGTPNGLVIGEHRALLGSASGGRFGYGFVFRLQRPAAGQTDWQASVLYDFRGGANGAAPGGLLFGRDKVIYGVTAKGGTACDCGTIFKIEQ
jgi:uncharacterized repeat protein (TIGR03803 family)